MSVSARRSMSKAVVSLCALVGVLLLAAGSAAASKPTFGSTGSGAGEFDGVAGVAVDQASGALYVANQYNERVDELQGTASFLQGWGWGVLDGSPALESCTSTCFEGEEGAGAGEFDQPSAVAVDNDPLSPSHGDVYVVDHGNRRVEQFSATGAFLSTFGGEVNETKDKEAGASEAEKNLCTAASGDVCTGGTEGTGNGQFARFGQGGSIAVGATGKVYVGTENRVEVFGEGGEYLSQVPLPGAREVTALAVDASGDLYVGSEELSGIGKYDAAGTLLETLDAAGRPEAVTLGPAGEVFIGEERGGFHVLKYSSAGVELASFGQGTVRRTRGMAFGETAGDLYVTGNSGEEGGEGVWALAQPSPGPLVESGSEQAGEVQRTSAVLAAKIDPEGAETTYYFEYGASEAYGSSTPRVSAGSGFEGVRVSAEPSGLTQASTYHYRVVAESSAGKSFGPDQTLTTLPAAVIEDEGAADVSGSSATLQADIDPLGSDTTYRFEYGTSTSYGSSAPVPAGDAGSGTGNVGVSAHPQGLQPDTVYHFRVVAANAEGEVDGPDQSFTTQPLGTALTLPDNREWELVSPPAGNEGATGQLIPFEVYGGQTQAAANGDAITYLVNGSVEVNPPGSAGETQVLSVRDSGGGWSSRVIATPHQVSAGVVLDQGDEYRFFSSDLSIGFVEPKGSGFTGEDSEGAATLSEAATENALTVYLRSDAPLSPEVSAQGAYDEASAEGGYKPLVTSKAGYANVPLGTAFGGELHFQGASPDGSHAVFSSGVPLTEKTPDGKHTNEGYGLYEWASGRLQLISVLPNGAPARGASLGSGEDDNVRGAISGDGSRIVWTTENHLYMRDVSREQTVQLDAPEAGVPLPTYGREGIFQFASSDGSRVFFTTQARLTKHSTAFPRSDQSEGQDLYMCEVVEVAGELTCKLTDLTVDPGGHAGVQGQVFAGSDSSNYVYFVASGVLGDGAEHGARAAGRCDNGFYATSTQICNLYVEHYNEGTGTWEEPVFIAALSGEDSPDWIDGQGSFQDLTHKTSRASANGEYFAFMSERSLTGYDNRDAGSGEPDEEVFLYDARSNRLVCASCNPTGEQPDGAHEPSGGPTLLVDPLRIWNANTGGLAGDVPGWTPMQTAEARQQPRYLSDSGRLFFNSPDALVAQATNGLMDVYEYEPVGVGSCEAASATFSSRSDGCVGLISSGTSGEESEFWDASENGDDVFFITHAQLASADKGSGLAVYDAHVCSAASPCPATEALAPACTTADSCRAAPTPQPLIFGAPSSATFSGAGNIVPEAARPAEKRRSLTRAQKLADALKACGKRPRKRRAACEAKARRAYGVSKSRRSKRGGK
jgi:hypothetical protein